MARAPGHLMNIVRVQFYFIITLAVSLGWHRHVHVSSGVCRLHGRVVCLGCSRGSCVSGVLHRARCDCMRHRLRRPHLSRVV